MLNPAIGERQPEPSLVVGVSSPDDMLSMSRWRAVVWCVAVMVSCGWRTGEGYPVGDLTSKDLFGRSNADKCQEMEPLVSNGCGYPGVVAITGVGRVLYTALYNRGTVRLPTDALDILQIINLHNQLIVYGDDGTATATIAQNSLKDLAVTNMDGTSMIALSTDFSVTSCPSNNAVLFDSVTMTVDLSTCTTASYGGNQITIDTYSGILQLGPLESSTLILEGCCEDVMSNLLGMRPNLGHPSVSEVAESFTCIKSGKGICSGDIGSPIYCRDGRSGQQVVVGMVDSGTCQQGEHVAAIDFTRGTLPGFSK